VNHRQRSSGAENSGEAGFKHRQIYVKRDEILPWKYEEALTPRAGKGRSYIITGPVQSGIGGQQLIYRFIFKYTR